MGRRPPQARPRDDPLDRGGAPPVSTRWPDAKAQSLRPGPSAANVSCFIILRVPSLSFLLAFPKVTEGAMGRRHKPRVSTHLVTSGFRP